MHISLNTAPKNHNTNSPERIKAIAQDFEAMFTSIMLRAMRGTVGENPLIPSSMGEKIYTDMLDSELATLSARNASLGLSDMLIREIERHENPTGVSARANELSNIPLWATQRGAMAYNPYSSPAPPNSSALLSRVGRWDNLITQASERYGVDKNLIRAVMARESAGDPYAVSSAGAKGLMQLMDGTARELGVSNSFSPDQNVNGGVRYLRQMLDMFDGNEVLALASYNAGPGNVRRYNGVPPFRETQHYIEAVLRLRNTAATRSAKETE